MITYKRATLNFRDRVNCIDTIHEFESIKISGSEAKFLLSGVTLRNVQMLRDGLGNFIYDPINKLIGGFPYKIDTKLDDGVILFEEEIE